MTGPADVPDDVLARVRAVCAPLPAVHEEPAWVGTRWRVRSRTFAHVLATDGVRPAAHVRVAGVTGPALLLVFRAAGMELDVLSRCGPPFFRGNWGIGVVGMVLGDGVDRQGSTGPRSPSCSPTATACRPCGPSPRGRPGRGD